MTTTRSWPILRSGAPPRGPPSPGHSDSAAVRSALLAFPRGRPDGGRRRDSSRATRISSALPGRTARARWPRPPHQQGQAPSWMDTGCPSQARPATFATPSGSLEPSSPRSLHRRRPSLRLPCPPSSEVPRSPPRQRHGCWPPWPSGRHCARRASWTWPLLVPGSAAHKRGSSATPPRAPWRSRCARRKGRRSPRRERRCRTPSRWRHRSCSRRGKRRSYRPPGASGILSTRRRTVRRPRSELDGRVSGC
mmetsp:Transcript_1073/g.3327  ORF Transcript_1073/g.3327 Transcript_1073/m.3327 type:complete len:250 (-) Transcript_1073:1913-2662(-)